MKGRAYLEVGRAWPAQGSGAEERSAEVCGPAACAGDDTAGRPVEREPLTRQHASLGEDVVRVGRPLDEELGACAPVERPLLVRADRGLDPQRPQDRERAARNRRLREVELEPKLAASEEVSG